MSPTSPTAEQPRLIRRFSRPQLLAHLVVAVTFFVMLWTGACLYSPALAEARLQALRDETQEDEREREASKHDLNYVSLDGASNRAVRAEERTGRHPGAVDDVIESVPGDEEEPVVTACGVQRVELAGERRAHVDDRDRWRSHLPSLTAGAVGNEACISASADGSARALASDHGKEFTHREARLR